jgi:hypothetical protein
MSWRRAAGVGVLSILALDGALAARSQLVSRQAHVISRIRQAIDNRK